MIDIGEGPAIVLIPGVQGRWEWMKPAVQALASRARVISYTLCGDRGSGCSLLEERGFENLVLQLENVFDAAGLRQATVCGVSFGGLIALRFAARHPDRANALVLASTPGPRWKPDQGVMKYVRRPRLLAPLFAIRSAFIATRELAAALPNRRSRWAWKRRHLAHIVRAPFSPVRMAERVRFALQENFSADCLEVKAPTLVMTGEKALDRVVPSDTTREYVACIPGARAVELERTGHLGVVTRPDRFAEIVCGFVEENAEP